MSRWCYLHGADGEDFDGIIQQAAAQTILEAASDYRPEAYSTPDMRSRKRTVKNRETEPLESQAEDDESATSNVRPIFNTTTETLEGLLGVQVTRKTSQPNLKSRNLTTSETQPSQMPEAEIVCKFWKTGLCKRGESCRFRHEVKPDTGPSGTPPMFSSASSTAEAQNGGNSKTARSIIAGRITENPTSNRKARGADPLSLNDPWNRYNPRLQRDSAGDSSSSHWPVFETFEWEEDELETEEGTSENSPSATSGTTSYHTNTRPPGQEALLVDTGAVHNLTGQDFVDRQTKASGAHGLKTTWSKIPGAGKKLSGIGDNAKTATQSARVYGVLSNGDLIQYEAPVIPPGTPGDPSPVPPLYGLDSMSRENVVMSMRTGLMALVPDGMEPQVKYPPGTKFRQCVKAPSGHWTLPVSHWSELNNKTVKTVFLTDKQED